MEKIIFTKIGLEKVFYEFKDNQTFGKEKENTKVAFCYDENYIYAEFLCEDNIIYSPYKEFNSPLYRCDNCELFISPNGDLVNYYELHLSPSGAMGFVKIYNPCPPNFSYEYLLKPDLEGNVQMISNGYKSIIRFNKAIFNDWNNDKALINAFRINAKDDCDFITSALNPTGEYLFHYPSKMLKINWR